MTIKIRYIIFIYDAFHYDTIMQHQGQNAKIYGTRSSQRRQMTSHQRRIDQELLQVGDKESVIVESRKDHQNWQRAMRRNQISVTSRNNGTARSSHMSREKHHPNNRAANSGYRTHQGKGGRARGATTQYIMTLHHQPE